MKKFILGLASIIWIAGSAQVPNYIPTNGLAGWWSFSGNANDGSGNGNNGTVNGASLNNDRFGNANSAYQFSGNSKITVPNSTSLSIGTNSFTVSAWVKLTGNNSNFCGMFAKLGSVNGNADGAQFVLHQNALRTEGPAGGFTSSRNLYDNNWHNVVWVVNRLTTSSSYYVDGVIDSTQINSGFGTYNSVNTANLLFGCDWTQSYYLNATMDDIGYWHRALSQQEITTLYSGSSCTFYDTITTHITVYDTTHVTIYDTITTTQTVYDTVTTYLSVNDTLKINVNLTGVNPPNNINTLSVYPNPANDHLLIDNGNLSSMNDYSIKITNALGQIVFNQPVTQQSFYIDLSTWGGNGTYFLYVIDPNQTVKEVKKIVLQ